MLEDAKKKLQAEMEASKDNAYVQCVGGFLLQHIESNPGDAEKVMAKDKTVAKSLDAMKKEVSKKKVGNVGVLTPQEGFTIVMKYFGITGEGAPTVPTQVPIPERPPAEKKTFDVSLDDLL